MILNSLSAIWAAVAPTLGNHLWQSTLCLAIAGLLTLVLRKNHARARYALWLAASVKFLIPFSLLVMLGAHLARPHPAAGMQTGFYVAMEEVSQPFTLPAPPAIPPAVHSTNSPNLVHLLPAILIAVWFCGFVAVLLVWYARWRRISAVMRESVLLSEGREVEALRRLERVGGMRKRIEFLVSPASLEPGIFGIVKPVLIWPKGISKKLQDAHLEAILAHEVGHVRRRDNLAAAIHMVVEAIFWFHPLVWWLGGRLIEERERACDEEVLATGSDRQSYAESILKTCEFCLESPLACMSGITGADLKKRIVHIMTERLTHKLSLGRKLLLAAVGMASVAGPVMFGLVNAQPMRGQSGPTAGAPSPSFEVASIKPDHSSDFRRSIGVQPGRFTVKNITTKDIIAYAYNVKDFQISGGPGWINSDKYDIEAKEDDLLVEAMQKFSFEQRSDQIRLRVQSLLADRFKLSLSHATKELPVYALVIAKNGPKLQESKAGDTYPQGIKARGGGGGAHMMQFGRGQLTAQGVPVAFLAQQLSQQLGRTVVDQTGLKGSYDFTLKWTPDQSSAGMMQGPPGAGPQPDNAPPPDSAGPSIFTALQEQLGLKLDSTKGPVEFLVIDHVEKPSEN